MPYPIIDMHCDLLSYLNSAPNPDPQRKDALGCSFPALAEGNVKLQVLAIYTATKKGSSELGLNQSRIFKGLFSRYEKQVALITPDNINDVPALPRIGLVAAIESGSGFCEEDEPLDSGFKKLEEIISNTERVLYISMTHHTENRFGGGNFSKIGLKEDGKALLNYINGRKIAIDFSHTSDALAHGILEHLTKHSLDIPILASHSNYRPVFDHPRNLPDELAKEVSTRGGVIGVNFVRAFINDDEPEAMYDHIQYGLDLGGEDAVCMGADFFYTGEHPDQTRAPFYHVEHESATCYPDILEEVLTRFSADIANKLSRQNAFEFINRVWN
ncbi:MAG: membrane dipeptidase [Cyclobacteriaceae bacterium]